CQDGGRLLLRPRSPRRKCVSDISGLDQSGGRMVSAEGASAGNGNFQCGHQYGCDPYAFAGAVDCTAMGLAIGFRGDWRAGSGVAAVLDSLLPGWQRPRNRIPDVGSVGGGWLSSALIKRGWSVNRARKATMLAMALLIVPTTLASRAPNMWTAVIIVGVAAAAHQAWSANVYTLASDMFPKVVVGSVVGIGA